MEDSNNIINEVTQNEYKWGFTTDIETETAPKGLSEDTVRFISTKKNEPEWMLEFRLKAYRYWINQKEPTWAHLHHPPINYQDIYFYAAPKPKKQVSNLEEVDPELLDTFEKLGISLNEQKMLTGVAVDAVMDSISVTTTFKESLAEKRNHFLFF